MSSAICITWSRGEKHFVQLFISINSNFPILGNMKWDPTHHFQPKKIPNKYILQKVVYKSSICALSCDDGVHIVDLQTQKNMKILKTFSN